MIYSLEKCTCFNNSLITEAHIPLSLLNFAQDLCPGDSPNGGNVNWSVMQPKVGHVIIIVTT